MRLLVSLTALPIFVAFVSSQASADEPIVQVAVDSDAFDKAASLFGCLQAFKARHREERENSSNLDRLNQQERAECKVPERQKALSERLRLVYPEMTEAQLGQKYQEVVLLAAFAGPKGLTATAKTPDAPNR